MSATGIAELTDAGEVVAGGSPAGGGGAYVEALRDEAGVVVGAVDWVVRTLTGFDLVVEIIEPLAGDYAALDSARQGWQHVAVALDAVAGNHRGLATQLPGVWQGLARTAAAGALDDLASTSARQAEAATLVAEQLGHVMAVSTAGAELVCAGLRLVDDIVLRMAMRMAAGPAGAALNAAAAPVEVARVVAALGRIQRALRQVAEVVDQCLEAVVRVKAVVDAATVAVAAVAATGHARAGARTDDTAGAGFS